MINVYILLICFAGLSNASILRPRDTTTTGCLDQTEMWGSEDGTKFYFCLPGTDTVIEQSCPPNTFFVKNPDMSGCVALDDVSDNCIYKANVEACEGINLLQPQTSSDPTKFYLCTTQGSDAVLLQCPDGTAFAKQDGYTGCFQWSQWRAIRNCYEDN